MNANVVNSVGLVLDIIGAVMLWKYGLPEALNKKGHQYLILEDIDEAEKRTAASYERRSRAALLLLVLGFAFQLWSNWLK
jgi:hypothetical protein